VSLVWREIPNLGSHCWHVLKPKTTKRNERNETPRNHRNERNETTEKSETTKTKTRYDKYDTGETTKTTSPRAIERQNYLTFRTSSSKGKGKRKKEKDRKVRYFGDQLFRVHSAEVSSWEWGIKASINNQTQRSFNEWEQIIINSYLVIRLP